MSEYEERVDRRIPATGSVPTRVPSDKATETDGSDGGSDHAVMPGTAQADPRVARRQDLSEGAH